MRPAVRTFFDEATFTATHVVSDPQSACAAVIDPVLGYDPATGRTDTRGADVVIDGVRRAGLRVDWVLETHIHADHLSAGAYLKAKLGAKTGIGDRVGTVQAVFKDIFHAEADFVPDGGQFDHLFGDGETFPLGGLRGRVLYTPGHTPACVCYIIGDAIFVGDTLFMPDSGTARCDFPGGDAAQLYRSVRRILELPRATRVFPCHDYGPGGRPFLWETTVAAQRVGNIHIHDGIPEREFVAMRRERDIGLKMPSLIIPATQINMRAGALPPPEDNGKCYLKVPLNVL